MRRPYRLRPRTPKVVITGLTAAGSISREIRRAYRRRTLLTSHSESGDKACGPYRGKSRKSKAVKSSDGPSAKKHGAEVSGGVQSATQSLDLLYFQYSEDWKAKFARDCVFWRFDVTHLLQRNLLRRFLERLKQVQLLDFFHKTCEVIAPRDLIVNFILECEITWISSTKRVLTYDLYDGRMARVHVVITRKSFAEALQLPVVETNHDALLDYSNPKFFRSVAVEWLGREYFGILCQCFQMDLSLSNGFADCILCSAVNPPESYWLLDEIKDPSIKDLIHFIGLWIHNTSKTACLRRAVISSVLEALKLQRALQIWTQHLWTNFLWTVEKLKEAGSSNFPCECSFSTAGVISALLSGHTRRLRSWNRAWQVWEKESYSPGMKECKDMIEDMNTSDSEEEIEDDQKPLNFYQKRKLCGLTFKNSS